MITQPIQPPRYKLFISLFSSWEPFNEAFETLSQIATVAQIHVFPTNPARCGRGNKGSLAERAPNLLCDRFPILKFNNSKIQRDINVMFHKHPSNIKHCAVTPKFYDSSDLNRYSREKVGKMHSDVTSLVLNK